RRFAAVVRVADVVVAGNAFLGEQAERWAGRVPGVPTRVDPGRDSPGGHTPLPDAQRVWDGSAPTAPGPSVRRPRPGSCGAAGSGGGRGPGRCGKAWGGIVRDCG